MQNCKKKVPLFTRGMLPMYHFLNFHLHYLSIFTLSLVILSLSCLQKVVPASSCCLWFCFRYTAWMQKPGRKWM